MEMLQQDDGDSSVLATTCSVSSCNETVLTNASTSTVKTSNVGRVDSADASRNRDVMMEELSRRKLRAQPHARLVPLRRIHSEMLLFHMSSTMILSD
jgi:hypothetical protein